MRPFPEHALAALAVIATAAAVYSAREGLTDLIGPTPSADELPRAQPLRKFVEVIAAELGESAPTVDDGKKMDDEGC